MSAPTIEPVPEFAFTSEREAAAKIHAAAKAAGVSLHPLPYSRFAPDKTTWWLSPDSANPAYAFGKIVVEGPTIVYDGAKLIGLHVEKGVGNSAAPVFEDSARGRRLMMGRDWTWHPFFRAVRSGELDASLHDAEAAAGGLPLVVEVVASLQYPPKLDDVEDRPVDPDAVDRIRYRWSTGSLVQVHRQTAGALRALKEVETMSSIGEKIAAIKDLDWTWVEVVVGVPFHPVATGGLAPTDLWQRVCTPWMRWLR